MEEAKNFATGAMNNVQFEELREEILEVLHEGEHTDYTILYCILTFLFIIGMVFLLRKLFLDMVTKQTKKTDNEIDDFLVGMVASWLVIIVQVFIR